MSLAEIQFQVLTDKDLEQVLELDQICFGGLWSLDSYKREIESPNSYLLIITVNTHSGTKVIGFGCFWAILEEAHITILAIHPDFQGQGLGSLLLENLLKEAVNRKLERATLEVGENNTKAINLYQKFGFKEAGRRKKYYKKTGEDALILWKSIRENT
ncbi:ribosomal protein S18-alanine N-acetyltransferase [Cyanobacterium aponinum UTEX 3222]|uniref:ribosomal protein S18-alanine N-acetyltransferase n=1 Tax=Cyanobacterium aponinum TaxID=379064 RepID=UPI000C12AB86|nr:ribosomal protein S18-alanine N-acetyltransferase [Cyanobacterium aponinum]PHV63620.1 ribosomal-protein-alanine N-acetyltransferase [Cyanobacterium aponinum IPPAS B-1201]WRL40012.1 ribosomal protein S18-alanine N-acetyltransferase [Cyanobacterium aponinum UTEX 3221]WRL42902.1 ribosomal protein S18-alanine N-acetyltransferase [Cyanobacterium aponinum UTEX 3222]